MRCYGHCSTHCKSLGTSSSKASWKSSCSTPVITSSGLMSQNICTTWKAKTINGVTPRALWTIAAVFWESFTSSVNFPSWKKPHWLLGDMKDAYQALIAANTEHVHFQDNFFNSLSGRWMVRKAFAKTLRLWAFLMISFQQPCFLLIWFLSLETKYWISLCSFMGAELKRRKIHIPRS